MLYPAGAYFLKTLLSVPAIRRFIFSRWRTSTIIGIAMAAVSSGHRFAKSQAGVKTIIRIKAAGKAMEAVIEASETYRVARTTTTQSAKANAAAIV